MERNEFEKIVLSVLAVNVGAFHSDIVHHPRQIPPFIASIEGLADPVQLRTLIAATFNRNELADLAYEYFKARENIHELSPYRFERCDGVRAAYLAGSYLDPFSNVRKTKIHIILPVFLSKKKLKTEDRVGREALGHQIASMFNTVIQFLHVRLQTEGKQWGLKALRPGGRNCSLNLIFAANIDYHPGLTGSPSLYQIVATELDNYGYRNYMLQATTLLLLPLEKDGKRALLFNEFGALVGGTFIDEDLSKLQPDMLEREVSKAILECGWETILAGRTNQADGGVDVVAYRDLGENGRAVLAVQVKSRGITACDVRNLRGLLSREDLPLNAGIIVSSAAFTQDALWEARQGGKVVELFGNEQLRQFAEKLVSENPPIQIFTGFPTRLQLTRNLAIDLL